MLRARALALVMFVLTGCASGAAGIEYSDERDLLGNPFPVDCLDVSDVHPRIEYLPEASLRVVCQYDHPDGFIYGCWNVDYDNKDGVVAVASELTPTQQLATLKHEFCHSKMQKTHGSPLWHR